SRSPRSSRSAAGESTLPAPTTADRACRRRTPDRRAQRTHRIHAGAGSGSAGGRTDEPGPWPTAPPPPTKTLAGAACACPSPCRELLPDLPPILPGKARGINEIRHFHHGLLGPIALPRASGARTVACPDLR